MLANSHIVTSSMVNTQALAGVYSLQQRAQLYLLVDGLCRCGWEGSRMACVGGGVNTIR